MTLEHDEALAWLDSISDLAMNNALAATARKLRNRYQTFGTLTADDAALVPGIWIEQVDEFVLPAVAKGFELGLLAGAEQLHIAQTLRLPQTAEAVMAAARNRMVNFGNELWGIVREQLTEGLTAGESIPELARRIEGLPGVAGPRATVVARTEIIGASNAGSYATARASGLATEKQWIATDDSRTREAHRVADGQLVGIDEAFMVGGEALAFPGDPNGSPENVIQCRCSLGYEVIEAEQGLPLAAAATEVTMPWSIVKGGGYCAADEWAVLKDSDGSTAGCHTTQQEAEDQMAALYANEADASAASANEADASAASANEADASAASAIRPQWQGVLALEGVETGDLPIREFAPGSLLWEHLPLPLEWQQSAEPEHNGAVIVGNIISIERLEDGKLWGNGSIDAEGEHGAEVLRMMQGDEPLLRWVSVNVDQVKDADVEVIMPEGDDSAEDMLFGAPPEKIVFHKGRIRGATLVNTSAFIEAEIRLVGDSEALTASAIGPHDSGTSDGSWDGPANEAMVRSPESLEYFRGIYAWGPDPDTEAEDGKYPKAAFRFIHHEIGSDGRAGAANLTACSTGIGVLHGGRGGTTVPAADKKGIYNHLAKHLRDGGKEVPPFEEEPLAAASVFAIAKNLGPTINTTATLTAAGHVIELPERPPIDWFQEPKDVPIHGALTITDEGRVYGYLAPTNVGHISPIFKGRTVPLGTDYGRFHRGEVITASGDRIVAGNITMGCNHAPRTGSVPEIEQFENTCAVFARCCVGENRHGVWVAGALLASVTADQIERAMACQLSGYWRPKDYGAGVELFSALLVPVPGFPMARRGPSVRYQEGALAASAVPVRFEEAQPSQAIDLERISRLAQENAKLRQEKVEALAASVLVTKGE